VEESLPAALVDREAVSRAVLNLIDNRLKYSTDRKDLRIRVWKRNGEVAIQVADQGIGIPESEQRHIFEKFYRVNAGLVHDTKAAGWLDVNQSHCGAHSGRIEVDSRPELGVDLRFSSPSPRRLEPQVRQEFSGEPLAEASHH